MDVPTTILFVTALGAGVLRGFTGFGGALAMAPVFTTLLGPIAALGTISALNVLTTWQMVRPAWRLMERPVVLPMIGASLVLTPAGMLAIFWLQPDIVRTIIGFAVAASGLLMLLLVRRTFHVSSAGAVMVGAVGGVLNGLAGIGGPPAALCLLSRDGPAGAGRAGLIVYVAATQLGTAIVALALGALDLVALIWALLLAPVYILGTAFGAWLFRRAPDQIFRFAAAMFVTLLGLVVALA